MPLTSNYKGFPLCQANDAQRIARAIRLSLGGCGARSRCGLASFVDAWMKDADSPNYNRSLVQRLSAADPDERRTRGTPSLVGEP